MFIARYIWRAKKAGQSINGRLNTTFQKLSDGRRWNLAAGQPKERLRLAGGTAGQEGINILTFL